MGWFSGFHVEVNFAGAPLIALLAEQGGDEAQQRGFVGEQRSDASASFEFLVHALDGVAGAHPSVMGNRQSINGKALRDVCLHPNGEFGSAFGIKEHALFEKKMPGI